MDEPVDNTSPSRTMTRTALALAAADATPALPKPDVRKVLEAVLDELVHTFTQGTPVKLRGFGSFVVRTKEERLGRNPRTGEPAAITPRRVLMFRPSRSLIEMMNPDVTIRKGRRKASTVAVKDAAVPAERRRACAKADPGDNHV